MKKFMVLSYVTPEALVKISDRVPEEMQETMKLWLAWNEKYRTQVIDMGAPLFGGVKVLSDGSTEASKREVAGFMMVEAESLKDAIELLKVSPLFDSPEGSDVEIHEAMAM
jgi:hypothetical protein